MSVQITITIKDRCSMDIQHQGDAHVLEDCGMEAVELLAGYVDKIALVHAHNRERNDLPNWAWVQHLQEELMDAVNYLEKIQVLAERGEG